LRFFLVLLVSFFIQLHCTKVAFQKRIFGRRTPHQSPMLLQQRAFLLQKKTL